MAGEDPTREQVRLAHVVDEAADVPVEVGVDAVNVLWLRECGRENRKQTEESENESEKR